MADGTSPNADEPRGGNPGTIRSVCWVAEPPTNVTDDSRTGVPDPTGVTRHRPDADSPVRSTSRAGWPSGSTAHPSGARRPSVGLITGSTPWLVADTDTSNGTPAGVIFAGIP